MASPQTKKQGKPSKSEKPFDEMISDLITQRKIQQDALLKIKASVAKRQVADGGKDQTHGQTKQLPNLKQ
jgi:hypothetical protein